MQKAWDRTFFSSKKNVGRLGLPDTRSRYKNQDMIVIAQKSSNTDTKDIKHKAQKQTHTYMQTWFITKVSGKWLSSQ